MPSTSKTQYRFFRMAAMDKEFAKKHKIKPRDAKEWHEADKKKKKEDPDWWDNLPEKTEKGSKNESEVSTEGMLDTLAKVLGVHKPLPTAAAVHEVPHEIDVRALRQSAATLKPEDLKEGSIEVVNPARKLGLLHWSNNWLSDVENIVTALDRWVLNFMKIRTAYSRQMQTDYKHAETLEPAAAAAWFVPRIHAARAKVFKQLRTSNFPNWKIQFEVTPTAVHTVTSRAPGVPQAIPALTMPVVHKILHLLDVLNDLKERVFDETEDDWTLDDTDEVKWWSRRYPDTEDYMHFLNLLPCAGEFPGMEIDEFGPMTQELEKGLAGILYAGLKK